MPRQKYNYTKLKAEFIKSDFDEVKSFITHKWLKYNAERGRRTKGWAKEKQENDNKALIKATEDAIAKKANALEIPMEQLTLAKKNAVVKVIQKMMKKDLDMQDLERTIRILRTEMWLPTTYSKNENMNTEKIEWIHILMWGKLIDSSKSDENNA